MGKETSPTVSKAAMRQRASALRDFAERFDRIAAYMEQAGLETLDLSASESWKRAAAALLAYTSAAQRACDKHALDDDCPETPNPNHTAPADHEPLIVAEKRRKYT